MKTSIFSKKISFLIGAVKVTNLPEGNIPEVCFVGRSNVGKSSLINALTNNNKVARTSKTPGCTQQLNFFDVGQAFRIVDLPGYGYAKASKQKIKHWNQLIFDYLRGRPQLVRVFALVDCKVGLTRADGVMLDYLKEYGVSCQIIVTKTDKLNTQERATQLKVIEAEILKYPNCMHQLLPCSAFKTWDIEEVRQAIVNCVEFEVIVK